MQAIDEALNSDDQDHGARAHHRGPETVQRDASITSSPRAIMPEALEDVWSLSATARPAEPVALPVLIVFAGRVIASTDAALRVLETSHPPVYYLPREAFHDCTHRGRRWFQLLRMEGRRPATGACAPDGRLAEACAWSYKQPDSRFRSVAGSSGGLCRIAWMAASSATNRSPPQPGGFYGGWITSNLKGPFKGVPGSGGW